MILSLPLRTILKQYQDQKSTLPQGTNIDDLTQYMVFNPLLTSPETQELEMIALVLFAAKLSKTDKGLEILRDLGVKYLDTVGKIIADLEKSSASNWLTAAINQMLCSRVMRRMGLISVAESASYQSTLNWIVGAMITKEAITDTLQGLTSFALGGGVRGITGAVSAATK